MGFEPGDLYPELHAQSFLILTQGLFKSKGVQAGLALGIFLPQHPTVLDSQVCIIVTMASSGHALTTRRSVTLEFTAKAGFTAHPVQAPPRISVPCQIIECDWLGPGCSVPSP